MNDIKGQRIKDIRVSGYGDNHLIVTLDTGEPIYMDPLEIMAIKGFNDTIFEAKKKRTRTWLKAKQ